MIYLVELLDDYGHDIYFIGNDYKKAETSFLKATEHLKLTQQESEQLLGPIQPRGKMTKIVERFFPYKNEDVNIAFLAKSTDSQSNKSLYLKQFQDNWEEPLN